MGRPGREKRKLSPMNLAKADVRRALIRHHFAPVASIKAAFERLKSVQFDPIAPVGTNHDLVLQSRVPGYKIGDWQSFAYQDRALYDGWDKQASLVQMQGWPARRFMYEVGRTWFEDKIFTEHPDAVTQILKEIDARGPLLPKECEFQSRKAEWAGSWYGPSLTKQTLRALWHSGLVMTAGRKGGHHLYDLTERVVPAKFLNAPALGREEAVQQVVLDRHRTMGLLRPGAAAEVWPNVMLGAHKKPAIQELVRKKDLIPVSVDGVAAHATPEFLALLDEPRLKPKCRILAPLDPLMWDRKMVAHVFGFDYIWEIYTPLAKRKWGYYVLPILFGDAFVARAEFWCRAGMLELREWHNESAGLPPVFWPSFEKASRAFMAYCSANEVTVRENIAPETKDAFLFAGRVSS